MKPIFLFLVLLNLAYLGWQTWIVPPKAPPALIEGVGVPRLVLIGEDPNDPAFSEPYTPTKLTQEAAAKFMPRRPARKAQMPSVEDEPVALITDARSDQQVAQQSREQLRRPVPPDTPDPQKEQQAAQPAPATIEEPTRQQDAVALEAPDETPPPAATLASANQVPGTIEVAMAPAGLRCVSLGPFLNLREATEATAMLIEAGLEPSQRLAESQVWFGHWVHLPPQASRQAAVALVEELRQKGVSDIYIEPSGPMQNSISLGVFSDRKYAETRAGQIRKLGISPQIRDRYRDSSVYWVDFELPEGQVIDPNAYQASSRRVLRLEGRTCPDNG